MTFKQSCPVAVAFRRMKIGYIYSWLQARTFQLLSCKVATSALTGIVVVLLLRYFGGPQTSVGCIPPPPIQVVNDRRKKLNCWK